MTTYSEQFVRDATRYVLTKEYRPGVLKSGASIAIAASMVLGLFAADVISVATMSGLLLGVAVATVLITLVYLVGYRQNLRHSSVVLHNEGTGEVTYEISEAGCKVKYKGGAVLLPWRLLKSRETYGEYEVLAFGPSESDSDPARARETLESMSRGAAGAEMLGFPIFCAIPRPRTRYVFVPPGLVRNSPHVPAS